jgi:glutaminyl-tRNA synthetase
VEEFAAANHPQQPEMGERKVGFSRVLYIEQEDFQLEPTKGFFRMTPGAEVRLRYAYIVRCTGVMADDNGNLIEVHCEYDPASRGGTAADGRKIKGTIHWVSASHAIEAEVRLFDYLFTDANPDRGGADYKQFLNPASVEILTTCKLEASLADSGGETQVQFERMGYFRTDAKDSAPGKPVFNRSVTLKDTRTKK